MTAPEDSDERSDGGESSPSDERIHEKEGEERRDLTRSAGQAEGRADGAIDGVPEGRAMALMVLVRRGHLTSEQARLQLKLLHVDGLIDERLCDSACAVLRRLRTCQPPMPTHHPSGA